MGKTKSDRRASFRQRFRIFLRTISINWKWIAAGVMAVTFLLFNLDWIERNLAGISAFIGFVLQMTMMIAITLIQFVVLMWFLSRGRLYWISPTETGVTFADYKGSPDVLELARRVVILLRGVAKFKQMGGEVSRGLLLIGPPGTGKSYLAQAIASEAGVPFAYLSAPSLQSMWMGVGSMKVMSLYKRARKQARKWGACIVFIDEIDAIGTARSSSMGGGMGGGAMGMFGGGQNLLNELLMQMDPPNLETGWWNKLLRMLGLRVRKAEQPVVFTMAATNLAETLDKALLRPGRFDRKILVSLPDYEGRKEIIQYYLDKVTYDPELNLDRLSSDTIGYSPAEIKFIINEAVVNAHFSGRSVATYKDWSAAREFNEWGLRQPIRAMNQDDRRRIAYHEAGHAVAAWLLRPQEPPIKATIIRYTSFLGAVQSKPLEERVTELKEEILADIQVSLAARAVEKLVLKTEMNGVTSDLKHATWLAGAYVGVWGMAGSLYSNLAFNQTTPDGKQKSQIEKILEQQFQQVFELMQKHEASVHAIAQALLEREELDRDEIEEIMMATSGRGTDSISAD
ncbi:MAG TPA: AAA family ATPase [Symbiobacteriaceae bacterium]|nr:AAA family ATPase [Symbiobacteriaceae bacterium]